MVVNCNSTYTFSFQIKTFIIKPQNAAEIVRSLYFYKSLIIDL